jgi:hypothetical protein
LRTLRLKTSSFIAGLLDLVSCYVAAAMDVDE